MDEPIFCILITVILKQDLVLILEAMRIIAVALSPVTPNLCLRIYRQLGYTDEQFHAIKWVFPFSYQIYMQLAEKYDSKGLMR